MFTPDIEATRDTQDPDDDGHIDPQPAANGWVALDRWLSTHCHVCGSEGRKDCNQGLHKFWRLKLTRKRYSL